MTPGSWLFLLFNLPAKQSSGRVKVWRRLKKFGAIQLKTSTYVLPDEPVHYERFQFSNQLQKLRQRYQEIREIDYFQSPRGEDLQRLLQKAEALESPEKKPETTKRLRVGDYRDKTWLTRPCPEIDRVGSAWLIRKFIDPSAKFVFAIKR
jgi:ChrB, C-terminal domain/Protein ChrB, N-terminal